MCKEADTTHCTVPVRVRVCARRRSSLAFDRVLAFWPTRARGAQLFVFENRQTDHLTMQFSNFLQTENQYEFDKVFVNLTKLKINCLQ